ncbi:sulfonate ABC transporter substrate-binding protein [Sphaerisporangium rufum]|uniref:Sulfonate ABC transporter substrate-binding protein n=1 Tax=Sphaerisporangium rufum TaxID=1381558 RepID=A0A919V3W9_9ACTN|nr:ABC transporter substrate-binding protein [Sphaerisporangium rufum]GII80548.1 sulfonate ABC transporter substrate-binding protein [Sphaerisporangium rufum]
MRSALRGRTFVVGLITALSVAACGGSDTGSAAAPAGEKGLEKTKIVIGALPIPDSAGIHIAKAKGFFQAEGLDVQINPLKSSADAVPALNGGSTDVILGNYFAMINVSAAKVGEYRFIADAFQAKPNVFDLVVPKDSPITDIKGLKGKKIAVPAKNSIGELASGNALRTAGLDREKDVEFIPTAFPEMWGAMTTGKADAAWLTEPFLTQVQQQYGAKVLTDTMTGAMADFPIAGWTVTKKFADANPKTVAAFQRAYAKAQQLAATDRKEIEKILPTYTKIPPAVISTITLGDFPTTLSAQRIQRVADLMLEYGYLKEKFDVTPMLVPMPQQ